LKNDDYNLITPCNHHSTYLENIEQNCRFYSLILYYWS